MSTPDPAEMRLKPITAWTTPFRNCRITRTKTPEYRPLKDFGYVNLLKTSRFVKLQHFKAMMNITFVAN